MHEKNSVAVVIPFYRATTTSYERIALVQCNRILANYPVVAIKPKGLTLPDLTDIISFTDVLSFDDHYFKGIKGYNSLMLSDVLYGKFLQYQYILIYQLDAFVFKDELNRWCNSGYDYIGAPWLRRKDYPHFLKEIIYKFLYFIYTKYNIKRNGVPDRKQFADKVGNGGLSLRRVRKFYDLSIAMRKEIEEYESREEPGFNEDAFWSVEVNRKKRQLNIPSYETALMFSIESSPARAMKLNDHQLPFGCHAWDLHVGFWQPFFHHEGYTI